MPDPTLNLDFNLNTRHSHSSPILNDRNLLIVPCFVVFALLGGIIIVSLRVLDDRARRVITVESKFTIVGTTNWLFSVQIYARAVVAVNTVVDITFLAAHARV